MLIFVLMKKTLLLILSTLMLAASCKKDDIHEDAFRLFDDKALPTLTISFQESEWKQLLSLYDADPNTKEYVHCDVDFSGSGHIIKIKDAGFRLRGQTSRRRPQTRNGHFQHFHGGLHLRKFNEDNPEIDGFRRINLKYAKEDPTYIREHYCFDLLNRFGVWLAPESSWCRLSLNAGSKTANYGVYLMIESIDKQYLKRRPQFGSAEGFLWKCAQGADLGSYSEKSCHLDDNSTRTYPYELKDDAPQAFETAKSQLRDFIGKFKILKGDAFREWAKQAIDVPLLLKMYAVNVAVGHWDDYWNNMNNFYIYFNSRDTTNYRMYLLPYDYDNTLGTTLHCGVQNDAGRHDPYKWGLDRCTLISKLLTVSEFRDMYTSYLKQLGADGNELFSYEASSARILRWQEVFVPYLANDTGEDMTIIDKPASWGNHSEYRVIQDGANNWFRVKCSSLNSL